MSSYAQTWPIPGGQVFLTITSTEPLPAPAYPHLGQLAAGLSQFAADLRVAQEPTAAATTGPVA